MNQARHSGIIGCRFELRPQGGYSQNFLSQILKIFVILTWILEPIKQKKLLFNYFFVYDINFYWYLLWKNTFGLENVKILRPKVGKHEIFEKKF